MVRGTIKATLFAALAGSSLEDNDGLLISQGRVPRRPGMPLLVLAALFFWVSAACAFGGHIGFNDLIYKWSALLVILVLLSVVASFAFKRAAISVISLFAVLGFITGCLGTEQMQAAMESPASSSASMRFVLEEDSALTGFGSSCIAEVESSLFHKEKVLLYIDTDEVLYRGQELEGSCSLSAFPKDRQDQYWLQGVSRKGTLKKFTVVSPSFPLDILIEVRKSAIELFEENCGSSAGLLQALVCGYRNTIKDEGSYERFKICGIAHIVAVSGAHLAIVATLLLSFLRLLKLRRSFAVAIEIVFLAAYLVFAGIPISALRATFMVVLSLTSFIAHRRSASLNSLGICIVLFILMSPDVCVSLSFFLSAGSVLGISLFSTLFASVFATGNERIDNFLGDQLSLTVASNVITLPASAALFSQLSLIAPVANIVAAPLFSLGCIVGLICVLACIVLPVLAPLFLGVAAICVLPLRVVVALMAKVPYACIAVDVPFVAMIMLTCALAVLLWSFWYKMSLRALRFALPALLIATAFIIFIPSDHGDRISMLDVGQGDSFLIESDGATLLIDTGNKDSLLREAIAERGIKHLDAVMITHPDSDHCDSLSSLSGYVDIGSIFVANDLLECSCARCETLVGISRDIIGDEPRGLKVGDVLSVGKFSLDVVWPHEFRDEGGNADSLSVIVSCDADGDGVSDMKGFFCGDAETDELKAMLNEGLLEDIDLLKVGHHGSKVAFDEDLIEKMSPSVALIGVGANNRYGHPSDKVLEILDRQDVRVLRSDLLGSVDISIHSDKMCAAFKKPSDDFGQNLIVTYEH